MEEELVVMREWKNWGPWGIPLEEVLPLLQKEDPLLSRIQLEKASKKKWKEECFPKLPLKSKMLSGIKKEQLETKMYPTR